MFSMILEENYEELDDFTLCSVNGGACCGGCGSSGGSSGWTRGSSSSSGGGYGQSSSAVAISSGGCGSNAPVHYIEQRYFSSLYSDSFGNQACAASSLLNELSEQYSAEKGRALDYGQIQKAMSDAVKNGSVDNSEAFVRDWESAANTMAKSMGLSGSYSLTSDESKASVKIYAVDKKGNGYVDHFVNDIGNGKYFDPYTGKTGDVSSLVLATKGNGPVRYLAYSAN